MKNENTNKYQIAAINAFKKSFRNNQKRMIINIPTGCEIITILIKLVEIINKSNKKILIITSNLHIKEQIEKEFVNKNTNINKKINIETIHQIIEQKTNYEFDYQFVIFENDKLVKNIYNKNSETEKTVIAFSNSSSCYLEPFFETNDIIFSYSFKDAIEDGIITPAMDRKALIPAVEVYCKQLLEQFGLIQYECKQENIKWDMIVKKGNKKIFVEYKTFKSQIISPSEANSLLKTIVMQKNKQNTTLFDETEVLVIVFSNIPSINKTEIYDRYNIIIWDINNLVYYSKNNLELLRKLSQITYFPIDNIKGESFENIDFVKHNLVREENAIINSKENEIEEKELLINQLKNCDTGNEASKQYEIICEKIIRYLFETNYFNRLTNQHKTNDEHFRMDLIGSLKINQINDDSIHPLWQMFLQHFNSHFIIFEFKNHEKNIDQNLVYITEKYLYDAALRNVAIIISRKGFSNSAKFAAEGCLKEHGKLILDITDNDLINMLNMDTNNASDYILDKMEDFLMGISK